MIINTAVATEGINLVLSFLEEIDQLGDAARAGLEALKERLQPTAVGDGPSAYGQASPEVQAACDKVARKIEGGS